MQALRQKREKRHSGLSIMRCFVGGRNCGRGPMQAQNILVEGIDLKVGGGKQQQHFPVLSLFFLSRVQSYT